MLELLDDELPDDALADDDKNTCANERRHVQLGGCALLNQYSPELHDGSDQTNDAGQALLLFVVAELDDVLLASGKRNDACARHLMQNDGYV